MLNASWFVFPVVHCYFIASHNTEFEENAKVLALCFIISVPFFREVTWTVEGQNIVCTEVSWYQVTDALPKPHSTGCVIMKVSIDLWIRQLLGFSNYPMHTFLKPLTKAGGLIKKSQQGLRCHKVIMFVYWSTFISRFLCL